MQGTLNEFTMFNFQLLQSNCSVIFSLHRLCVAIMIISCAYAFGKYFWSANLIFIYARILSSFCATRRLVSIGISVEPHDRPKAHVRPIHLSLQRKTKREKARIYWLESRQLHIATRISRALRAQLVDHEVRFIATLRVKQKQPYKTCAKTSRKNG